MDGPPAPPVKPSFNSLAACAAVIWTFLMKSEVSAVILMRVTGGSAIFDLPSAGEVTVEDRIAARFPALNLPCDHVRLHVLPKVLWEPEHGQL
jgi:hypothetical protein